MFCATCGKGVVALARERLLVPEVGTHRILSSPVALRAAAISTVTSNSCSAGHWTSSRVSTRDERGSCAPWPPQVYRACWPKRSELMPLFCLPHPEFRRLSRRARNAQKANHLEIAGLLAVNSSKPRTLRLVFLRNRAAQLGRWGLSTEDIAECRDALRASGLRHDRIVPLATALARQARTS